MESTLPLHRPAAGHPLRQALRLAALRRRVRGDNEAGAGRRGMSMQELREFLMAYCACFLAVSTFIA